MRITHLLVVLAPCLLCACIGGSKGGATNTAPPPATVNTLAVIVDAGPPGVSAINRPYVTVKVCVPGSTTCASIDHVLLDTGSWGLRLVRSVLTAGGVTLTPSTDAQGQTIEECAAFSGGQTWGPVAAADVTLAGEVAAKVPVQLLDDTNSSAPPPNTSVCVTSGSVHNAVPELGANGILGVGVFAHDCGDACVSATPALENYYGCTAAGVCAAENIALAGQVTNPVFLFAADNNGIIVDLPKLQNANGDATVQGQIIFGLATQTDNTLPATGLTVLGTDAGGDFTATYNGSATVLPALIDSGTDGYDFADPNIPVCTAIPPNSAQWTGYYCPTSGLQALFAVNTGVGAYNATNTVQFAVADPNSFITTAAAFINLGGGQASTRFTWGMPFFYGRKIYIGIEKKTSGTLTGPYYAY
jgi:hypothetical protein